MKAYQIQWDTDGDEILAAGLPEEIKIPPEIESDDDAISDLTGFCHFGFKLQNNSTNKAELGKDS